MIIDLLSEPLLVKIAEVGGQYEFVAIFRVFHLLSISVFLVAMQAFQMLA